MSAGGGERITWIGHATVLLELGGARLMTDPVLGNRVIHLRRHSAPPRPEHLERLDAVLISHLHLDHLDMRSLRRLGRDVALVVPRGAGRLLARRGFREVTEIALGERVDVRGASIVAVPAVHDGRRHPRGPSTDALGFVATGAARVYFAGDTEPFAGMAGLADDLDVALLPIWGWGPTLGPGHMDPHEAAQALTMLRPAVAVPIHWGTFFPAGLARVRGRALVDPPHAFLREAARVAPDVRVEVLRPGEALSLRAGRAAGRAAS